MRTRGALLLVVAVAVIAPGWVASTQAGQNPERFKRPRVYVDKDDRSFPHPAWVTTNWDPKADAVFRAAESETKPYRDGYVQDRSGKWPARARLAYEKWRIDCQSAEKLHRACVYFDIARTVDPSFGETSDDKTMREDLNLGWDVLRNPPRSYLFIRRGYGWNAGDRHRHSFGDLARALLKRDPLDRYVVHAAVGEYFDEGRSRALGMEQFLIDTIGGMRQAPSWSFLNYMGLATLYEIRAFRTTRRGDLRKAIECCDLAIKGAPKEYHRRQWLEDTRAELERRMKYMKID